MLVLYACIKQTAMVQQSIDSLKTDTFEYHKPIIRHVGPMLVQISNINEKSAFFL